MRVDHHRHVRHQPQPLQIRHRIRPQQRHRRQHMRHLIAVRQRHDIQRPPRKNHPRHPLDRLVVIRAIDQMPKAIELPMKPRQPRIRDRIRRPHRLLKPLVTPRRHQPLLLQLKRLHRPIPHFLHLLAQIVVPLAPDLDQRRIHRKRHPPRRQHMQVDQLLDPIRVPARPGELERQRPPVDRIDRQRPQRLLRLGPIARRQRFHRRPRQQPHQLSPHHRIDRPLRAALRPRLGADALDEKLQRLLRRRRIPRVPHDVADRRHRPLQNHLIPAQRKILSPMLDKAPQPSERLIGRRIPRDPKRRLPALRFFLVFQHRPDRPERRRWKPPRHRVIHQLILWALEGCHLRRRHLIGARTTPQQHHQRPGQQTDPTKRPRHRVLHGPDYRHLAR